MNSLSFQKIGTLVSLILIVGKIQSQSPNNCILSITELIPVRFLDSNIYFNPEDEIKNLTLVFNEAWVEQAKRPGIYCRAVFLRNATKKDKNNPKVLSTIYYTKNAKVHIDENTFYYDDKIYNYKDEKTQFANWLKIKASDYQNDGIAPRTQCHIGAILPDKFRIVDLNQFKRVPVHLVSYRSYKMVLSYGDSLLIGFVINQSDVPMFKDPVLLQELTNYELPHDLVNKKVVIEDFDHNDYKAASFPFYKINRIKSKHNDIHLLLEKYNSTGVRDGTGYIGIDLKNLGTNIYEYECFNQQWIANKIKFEEYLDSNFTPKEIEYIREGSIFLGMGESALYESIGKPLKTNTTVVKGLTHKQCIYGNGVFIYVENGVVSAWQNIESLKN